MGDHATINDPAANAPDAASADKGKSKAQEPTQELSMDEDESESESENEMVSLHHRPDIEGLKGSSLTDLARHQVDNGTHPRL